MKFCLVFGSGPVWTGFCARTVCFQTLQDLRCVSELLDSCTLIDLGSDLQTSRLLDCFKQAEPHFRVRTGPRRTERVLE